MILYPSKVVFDLDGTLADIRHRRHLVESQPKNWDAFYAAAIYDTRNTPICLLNKILHEAGFEIIILSGRRGEMREQTENWLYDHGIFYTTLVMRPIDDRRSDEIIKSEALAQLQLTPDNTLCIFEDRERLVRMWRDNGFTCLQVADGNF